MNAKELNDILEKHRKWLDEEEGGERANLRGANLSYADLICANLRGADLKFTDLMGADLRGADLRGAYLMGAYLMGAYLMGANLTNANLTNAYLTNANLMGAHLRRAKNIPEDVIGVTLIATAEIKTGWKKLANGLICKIQIPKNARRSNATSRKCRCEYAKVIEIWDGDKKVDKGVGWYDKDFIYEVGKTVQCHEWDDDRWNECSGGIHFFLTRVEAEAWE